MITPPPPGTSNIETVLFDLDGTLVHVELEFFFLEAHRLFSALEFEYIVSDIENAYRRGNLFELFPAEEREAMATRFWEDYRHEDYPHPRALEGVHTALHELQSMGLQLGIVTARVESPEQIRKMLSAIGLDEVFPLILSHGVDGPYAKDKVLLVDKALQHFRSTRERTLLIGDSAGDIVSGKRAGLALTIGVTSGGISRETLETFEPDYVLESVLELPSLLKAGTTSG